MTKKNIFGIDRSGTPEQAKRPALPEKPSDADFVYIVAMLDKWHSQVTNVYVGGETMRCYRTKDEAEARAGEHDVILTCQVLQVDRRRVVTYTEAVKRPGEP